MNAFPSWLRGTESGVRIEVLVQPRASRTRGVGERDGRLKIQVAAPPAGVACNDSLGAYFAEKLRLPKGGITIVAGETARRKSVEIHGVEARAVAEALLP